MDKTVMTYLKTLNEAIHRGSALSEKVTREAFETLVKLVCGEKK